MMLPSPLESLPVELLRHVCELLPFCDVKAFALVNKQSRSIAIARLFRSICISVSSRRQLRLCVDHWASTSFLGHVHRLNIDGTMPSAEEDHIDGVLTEEIILRSRAQVDAWKATWYGIADDQSPQKTFDEDGAWQPLADFIRLLPLADIYYNASNQFSPCLLEALHQSHPHCRLHIKSFRYRSLRSPDLDYYEFQLATSPSLYSIAVRYHHFEWNDEAVPWTISHLAPHLKDVTIGASISKPREPWDGLPRPPKVHWPGFSLDTQKIVPVRRGLVTRLKLNHPGDIIELNDATDFRVLKSFIVRREIEPKEQEWLIEHSPFQELRRLECAVPGNRRNRLRSGEPINECDSLLRPFIESFPPLRALTLNGDLSGPGIFKTLLERHGASLRELRIPGFEVSSEEPVDIIRQSCPLLEDLRIMVKRSKGNGQEQAIYKALGAIPTLQTLSLVLACENTAVLVSGDLPYSADEEDLVNSDPSFDEFHNLLFPDSDDLRPRYGHIRDNLINCALDGTLACAVFRCVSLGKAKARGCLPLQRCLSLQSLELCVRGGSWLGREDGEFVEAWGIGDVIDIIGQSWRVVRNPRDDRPGQLITTNITDERVGRDPILNEKMKPVFRRLWPEKSEGSDWRHDWHSFPLQDLEA